MASTAGLSLLMLQEGALLSPWALAIIAILLIALFIWLLLRWQWKKAAAAPKAAAPEAPKAAPVVEAVAPVSAAASAPIKPPDDLEIIEGIGPKICAVLNQAGITTFAQLASLPPAKITEIMQAGGIRLGDPRSWPEQARLAAAGDMDGLKKLQDQLKGGRAV